MKLKALFFSFISLFMFIFFIMNAYASSTFNYVWTNTKITIPVYSSINDYKDIPKATLYRDGIVLSDANITYNQEGDWLYYMKNVNTSKVGEYKVWYKAYDDKYIPGTCTDYKALITFYVRDLESPSLKIINEELYVRRGNDYDLNNNIVVKDNYCKDLNVTFNHNIDFNTLGEYDVNVVVKDDDGNHVNGYFKTIIYDNLVEPIISMNSIGDEISIPLNKSFDLKQYFSAYDINDGDITDKIKYPNIKNDQLGDYTYNLSVTNSAGITTYYAFLVHVIDDEEPVLILSNHSIRLDYKTDFSSFDFMKYIKELSDNVDIDYDNLSITHNLDNKVGNYYINYKYFDGIFCVSDSIDVSLISYCAPKIYVSNIAIKENENINLMDYIIIEDESDENILESVIINDNEVDYDNEGTYYATVFCINSSGLSSDAKFKIIVESDSLFSKSNIGISISFFVILIILIGLSTFIIIYVYKKKKKIKENNI